MKQVARRFESCSLAEVGTGLGWFNSNTEKSALVSNDSRSFKVEPKVEEAEDEQ